MSPSHKLDVRGNAVLGDGTDGSGLKLRMLDGTTVLRTFDPTNVGRTNSINFGAVGSGGDLRAHGTDHHWLNNLGTVEYMIIKDGNLGIGTTSPSTILAVVQNSDTDPIADAWEVYSSRRWKDNIQPLERALDKVLRLRGVTFDWKADGKHDIGMIAEEVGEVIPEVVAYEENGKDAKSLDYARLTAVLVEAVKAQQQQIQDSKKEVSKLKGKQ